MSLNEAMQELESYGMNNVLIGLGVRNEALREKAEAAAQRIGKVVVDHGETGCKTPDAISYMEKICSHCDKKKA